MYAVFVVSAIDAGRLEEANRWLTEQIGPQIKSTPGFISGTWARSADGTEGRSMVLFESEQNARTMLERATSAMPADGPVQIWQKAVLEVVMQV